MATKLKKQLAFQVALIRWCFYIRAIFGLFIIVPIKWKTVSLLSRISQRILTCIWFILYLISIFHSERVEYIAELHMKSALIVDILPKFILITLSLSTCLTLLFNHVYAGRRIEIIKQIRVIEPNLNPGEIPLHPKGADLILISAVLQCFYIVFWCVLTGPINYYKNVGWYEGIVALLPRFVATFFLMDYFTANAILLQEFMKNNEVLESLQRDSEQTLQYPDDERKFIEEIMNISERHREIWKIVKGTNRIYSLQLLVNIALFYAVLLAKTYIIIYAILLSSVETEIRTKIIIVNLIHLIVNGGNLLLLVEASTRLCQEAENTKTILWSIKVSEDKEESINVISCCSFQIDYNKVEIWALNMFKVDYQLIFTVVSSISTYLFLMFQYESYS